MARQFARFFIRSGNEQHSLAVTPPAADRAFDRSLLEVQQLASYPLAEPVYLPPGYEMVGADYEPSLEAAFILYETAESGPFLRISQRPTRSEVLDVGSVGAGADVVQVDIRLPGETVSAEYVAGAWKLALPTSFTETQPGLVENLQANWDPNAPIHMFRWESKGILYEIILADSRTDFNALSEFVRIAESMSVFEK
jgi:hypothetical protein